MKEALVSTHLVCDLQDENGGDSGYPSERRSEGDPNDHMDGVTTFADLHCWSILAR